MTGGIVMFAFLIPFALIFINRRKSRVTPMVTREMKDQNVKCTAPRADLVANNVFVVFNIFCCSKFSLVLLSLHFISDNLSPLRPPGIHVISKSSTHSPLKINNDWCGPLDTILRG